MFNFVGKQIVDGIAEGLSDSGQKIGGLLGETLGAAISTAGLPAGLLKIVGTVPSLWENLPQDQKQAFFNAAIAAGTKAMMTYAAA